MVKTVRDQLMALVLDNTNIRAACDDLRRQCHSQGVAFGDLSRLVNQAREDQEETRAYSHGRPDHTLVSGRSCWTLDATSVHGILGSRGRTARPFCMVSG